MMHSHVGRTIGLTSLTLGAAAGLVSAGALAVFRWSLPRVDGTVALPGLGSQVEVLRDRWGVPHIYAENNADLLLALGYVHAQDRLWQMELNRRTAQGQLAEVIGPLALSSDRFVRVLGLGRVARRDTQRMDEATYGSIESYVQGINLFVETHHNRLPLEFTLLRYQPQPWQVSDVVAYSKMIAYALSFNWTYELLNARLVAAVGEQRARELLLHYPPDHPLTVPRNLFWEHGIGEELFSSAAGTSPGSKKNGHRRNGTRSSHTGQGSNAWVVRGQRSSSGKPLLANDPHLQATLPAIWYEAHLEGGDYAVSGATSPGLPGVISGHNQHIAWGVTNAMTDVQDLYIEQFDPANPLFYRWQDSWEQAELVREEIQVKGQAEPEIEEVRITRHGPVLAMAGRLSNNGLEDDPEPDQPPLEAMALRWSGFDSSDAIKAGLALNRARNWQEFRTALADWDTPVQNVVYADTEGHYGYTLAGKLPLRARGDGQFPVAGWDGASEWTGYIPAEALPFAYDPPDGLVVSANNKITDQSYPYDHALHGEWLNGYRAARIHELLDTVPQHDIQSFARIQLDQHSLAGRELARLMEQVPLTDPLESKARDLLVEWDGDLHAESVGGAIYAVLRHHLERQAYAELDTLRGAGVGTGLFRSFPGREALARRSLPGILARIAAAQGAKRADPWLDPERTWNDVLQEALRQTVEELRERLGKDPKHWKYGRIHNLTLAHVLGRSGMLATLFNRGVWPTGGDLDTVCVGYTPRDTMEPVYIAPVYRQICDTGDWDASVSVLISGQSGQPASRHYCDMTSLWLRGDYHPMLWSRARVEQYITASLVLEPE